MRKELLLSLFIFSVSPAYAVPLELINQNVTLDGTYNYDYISLVNSSIFITTYNGTGTTGTLVLNITNISGDSTSNIIGSGRGFRGVPGSYSNGADGEGSGYGHMGTNGASGGGGAGYGSVGGTGGGTYGGVGGTSYGDINVSTLFKGSSGGSGSSGNSNCNIIGYSGNGSASLEINAREIIFYGNILLNGSAGYDVACGYGYGGHGGGSGGGLKLNATRTLNISNSVVNLTGGGGTAGNTGKPGGGGSGGRAVFYYWNLSNVSSSVTLNGGGAGGTGTIQYNTYSSPSNSAPTVPQISVPTNNSRHYNNSINYTWNTSIDADGDSILSDFWLSSQSDFSNTINQTNFTNNWSGSISTTSGVTYYGKVRAYDGYEYSPWSIVTQFTENTAPTVVNITLSPPSPSVSDNLTISMNGTDAEGDSLTKHYRWYKNGVLNTSWNDSTYVNATGNYTIGDQIYVLGFVNDGYENSTTTQSNTLIVGAGNSAPVLSGISLNPNTKKFNKTITVNTSSNITDTESTMVRLQVYRYVSGAKSYLGNSSWVAPPNNASVNITIPWSDGIAHTIYAQAQDNGNATQDNTTNLTSSEVTATFTSDTTSPTVNSSSVSPSSVSTGNDVTITITADGEGANISTANVTIILPSLSSVTLSMTCTYTSGDNSTCTRNYTTTTDGTYSIDSFGLTDESGVSASPASVLTFTASTSSGSSSGVGGGGGGTTTIIIQGENTTTAAPLLSLKNITATQPELEEISRCLTESLFIANKCSGYNYGVIVEPMNWFLVFSGAFLAAGAVVVGKGLYQDKVREWVTEPLLYGTTTTLIIIILVASGVNLYILNFITGSPKYAWTFGSTFLWGGIVALVWDNYYYGKKKYKILRDA